MVSVKIVLDVYCRVVYKSIERCDQSGVGFLHSRLCFSRVQCVVYIVYVLVAFDPLPCPLRPL